MGGYSLFYDGTSRCSACNLVPKILSYPERTFNLIPRVFSLSNIGKRGDPGNEVGERLTWLGQAHEDTFRSPLGSLATNFSPICLSLESFVCHHPDSWRQGSLEPGNEVADMWHGVPFRDRFGGRGDINALFTGRLKIILSLNCDEIVKMHSASSLKPQTNLKRYLFTFIPILSSDFSDFWLILKIWLL